MGRMPISLPCCVPVAARRSGDGAGRAGFDRADPHGWRRSISAPSIAWDNSGDRPYPSDARNWRRGGPAIECDREILRPCCQARPPGACWRSGDASPPAPGELRLARGDLCAASVGRRSGRIWPPACGISFRPTTPIRTDRRHSSSRCSCTPWPTCICIPSIPIPASRTTGSKRFTRLRRRAVHLAAGRDQLRQSGDRTGDAAARSRLGIRKGPERSRSQLMVQFMGEAVGYSLAGLVLGMGLAALFLPSLNAFLDRQIDFDVLAPAAACRRAAGHRRAAWALPPAPILPWSCRGSRPRTC